MEIFFSLPSVAEEFEKKNRHGIRFRGDFLREKIVGEYNSCDKLEADIVKVH